jgi:capsular polysaccharide biosynthesis protein
VGLVLTFAVIVVRDMVDTRVRTSNELEEIVGVPVVGHFPDVVG